MGIEGRIHSIETMGTLDGPGIRFVVFVQGCCLRCSYCHNPDTWDICGGNLLDVNMLMEKIMRYKPYMDASGGGVTVSGGEPALQPDFVSELFKMCKEEGIHTALDTSGYSSKSSYKRIIPFTDLVLFDIKHINPNSHYLLTGKGNSKILENLKYIDSQRIPIWIRHVIVPGITDSIMYIKNLAEFLTKIQSVRLVELLPYHNLGVHKWRELGIKYELENVLSPSQDLLGEIRNVFIEKGLKVA
ncbi:MAG TPA: pyruvate formate lyase-activating protein [Thermoanaerobacterales bacterium]|nr:pyruvate formate lyase-activating protein [Thermoanaerobacterales bacterium]